MEKRGQVTLFIIIGIILLIVFGLFYFIKSQVKHYEAVPEEGVAVYNFIEGCLKESAEKGIRILGEQGGYIYVPEEIKRNVKARLNLGFGFVKPLWYYPGHSLVPSEDLIKNQISRYVDENIEACLGNFSVFKDQYEIKELSKPKTSVSLNDKDVSVKLDYKIDVKVLAENKTIRMENFVSNIPVKLKAMLKLGKRIMDYENRAWFMENITIDFMAMDTKIPLTNFEFYCGTRTWYLSNIKKELQEVLKYNIPHIRIKNTDYVPFEETERVYQRYKKVEKDEEGNLYGLPKGEPPWDL